jgi:site-specific recombinase XerD
VTDINPKNERIKRRYLRHMQEARGLAASTIDNALRAIAEYERFTGCRDFGKFRSGDAVAYKKFLLSDGGKRAAELSNRSTVHGKLQPLQRFFRWLAEQDGYRTKVRFSDVDYFNLSNRDIQIARDYPGKPSPTLEQVQHVIRSMPAKTDIQKRDRAVVCCILLSGSRVRAATTLKLKHVRIDRRGIDFDARDVRTKFSKSFRVTFFPVGEDIREMFLAYVDFLRCDLMWNDDDPLFPCTRQGVGEACHFHTLGLARKHWATADPIRQIFRRAFAGVSLPYYCPHSIRRTLALLGERFCRTPEEFKAWSQNLGHDGVLTTFKHYGPVPFIRQDHIIPQIGAPSARDEEAFQAFLAMRKDPRFGALFGGK